MKTPAHIARLVVNHGSWVAVEVTRHGWPRHLIHFYGKTPGDDLMCTAILREMRQRGRRGVWMMSRFPSLFEGNQDVDAVVPFDDRYERMVSWLGGHRWHARYDDRDPVADRCSIPPRHIIALMCQACGLDGPVTLRPYLWLSARERAAGRLTPRQITVHSSGLSGDAAMRNKEWRPGRFQGVVHALSDTFNFIQLGAASDPPLDGALDLRGKTTLRESAAIVSRSVLFLGQVGFLMHLARAVDRPAVIVYGGREMPWQSGYPCNTNLSTPLPCAPCWRWNACDNPIERECMRRIGVDDVVAAVRDRAARADAPLEVDVAVIPRRDSRELALPFVAGERAD
jgi:hypothetical protein